MRTIKFRGKRVDNSEWVFGYYMVHELRQEHKIHFRNPKSFTNGMSTVEVLPETVGQFTGLKDKNGKEIYDGDRIDEFEIIEWCNNSIGWQVVTYDIPTKDRIHCNCYSCQGHFDLQELVLDKSMEVIGNIHDKYTKTQLIEANKHLDNTTPTITPLCSCSYPTDPSNGTGKCPSCKNNIDYINNPPKITPAIPNSNNFWDSENL